MRIDISGHHVEITDAIRQAVHQKLEKVASHYPQMESATVILTVEPKHQIAEVTTQFFGTTIAVESQKEDMYSAIADVAKRLESKLEHKKGTAQAKRHEKPNLAEDPTSISE